MVRAWNSKSPLRRLENPLSGCVGMTSAPTISIVINTLNRADSLDKTLNSLRWLNYEGDFEVVVVNGPSTDHSAEIVDKWRHHVRTATCDQPNLSMSRNIGIEEARGEIVCFLDDDGVPEPEWLNQIAEGYTNEVVGGVGGVVYDHTGYDFQYRFSTATRLANASWGETSPAEYLAFPGSFQYPYLQGTNASFRRSALQEIGGFDEEIEFYLDEVDVCVRLIDAGYLIRQLPNAYVHHKFAPSSIRSHTRIVTRLYPVIKNKIYYSIKHGHPYASLLEIFEDNRSFTQSHRESLRAHVKAGRVDSEVLERFESDVREAWMRGTASGIAAIEGRGFVGTIGQHEDPIKTFDTLPGEGSRVVVLVSRDYPPSHAGGVATYNKDLAEALAAKGHQVHVITESPDHNRVDFESGVWVHRRVVNKTAMTDAALELAIPQRIWNWSATALQEVAKINAKVPVDVVEAPIWDCEGIAFLLSDEFPLVTSLVTTLHFWLESHPDQKLDPQWMSNFGDPMIKLESRLMRESDGIRSISAAIRTSIEKAYGFEFSDDRIQVAPLGLEFRPPVERVKQVDGAVRVLFVGRLEERKGIDTLLDAADEILDADPNVIIEIIGDNTLAAPGGGTYSETFTAKHKGSPILDRVKFLGKVDDDELNAALERASIFVAPSRFESFGLVFVEAMRAGLPTVGCRAGGVVEIVKHEETGLLVPVSDSAELAHAILRLASSAELRDSYGRAGRADFEARFSSVAMAERSDALHLNTMNRHKKRSAK